MAEVVVPNARGILVSLLLLSTDKRGQERNFGGGDAVRLGFFPHHFMEGGRVREQDLPGLNHCIHEQYDRQCNKRMFPNHRPPSRHGLCFCIVFVELYDTDDNWSRVTKHLK